MLMCLCKLFKISYLAPQVGLEPTTLRLTAPEIWFLQIMSDIAIGKELSRYSTN